MAGPTVEELLRAGGQRRKPPPPPEVGGAETFVNRAVGMIPGANRLTDAIAAMALEAGSSGGERATLTPGARAELQAMDEDVPEDPGLVNRYREVRDRRAERTEAGSQQNPWAGRAGALTGFGLSLFAPLPKAAGAGWKASAKTGAGYGAFHGLTEGGADLTRGEFAEGAADTLKGAAMGAGLGVGLHGAMRLGQRATQGLRNARQDVIAQETAAAQEAAETAQAAAAKRAAPLERAQGQAMEMNKSFDKQGARASEREAARVERARRAIDRARRKDAPLDEPDTKMLEDMRAKAEERRAVNYDRVRQRQKDLEDPAITPEGKVENQQYIDRYGHAVNDPGAFRREFVERYLRQKYGPEMAERLMRERIGPRGEVLPRATPAPSPAAAADDVSAGARPRPGPGEEQLPPSLDAEPQAGRLPSPLAPPPTIREGAQGMPYGRNLRPEPLPPEPTTQVATQSMATPRDVPLESMSTRAASVPNIQRPPAPAAAPPAEVPTVPGRAAPQPPAPPPSPHAGGSQEVTRLGGPEDVGRVAAERAAMRERGALADRAWQFGEALPVVGPAVKVTREVLRDPAMRARVLSLARLHVLASINPALYARVGAQLQGGGQNQRAAEHLLARKDPEYREARQKAAEQVAAMSDQQLVDLFAQANNPI